MSQLTVGELVSVDRLNSIPLQDLDKQLAAAWVNFNGVGSVSIRDQFNVTSITDGGTGRYTVNFAEPLPNANYSLVGSAGMGSSNFRCFILQTLSTTNAVFRTEDSNSGNADSDLVCVTAFSS